jgi:hypothetical protein
MTMMRLMIILEIISRRRMNQSAKKNTTLEQEERKDPILVIWYLPMINRLKHMFSNPRDSELLVL